MNVFGILEEFVVVMDGLTNPCGGGERRINDTWFGFTFVSIIIVGTTIRVKMWYTLFNV